MLFRKIGVFRRGKVLKNALMSSTCKKSLLSVVSILLLTNTSYAGAPSFFRIGTGGQTGVYYPVGTLIAKGITANEPDEDSDKADNYASYFQSGENGVPGYIGVAQNSAGSIDNARALAAGEIEAGLVQADVAAWAFLAENMFKGSDKAKSLRAIASLYPEKFQIVVRRDADIKTVSDLRKKRISVDEIGSGTLAVMRIVLDAYGMSEKDLLPVYLKPVFTRDRTISGAIQGFVMMAGAPMVGITELSAATRISLVPISNDIASQIEKRYPYLVPGTIPAEVYPGIPETPTIQVHALMVVDKSMDDELAYRVTAALWSKRTLSMLKAGHPQGSSITPETALTGISIPLHEGAKRYYNDHPERFKGAQLN